MKKKKGSSLIFVLVTFAVIITFGVSVLSLTLVSYKKRLVETTEKRNQYFSESGIDIAYGVIGKTVDKAVEEGNNALDAEIKKLKDPTKSAELTNGDKTYLNADGSINEELLKQNVFLETYKSWILTNIKNDIEDSDYTVENSNNDKPDVKVKNGDSLSFQNNVLTLNLESNFSSTSKTNPSGAKEVKKTIRVTYKIGPAKYNKPISVTTVAVPMDLPWEKKVICANGNLTMKSTYNVTGDIYAKGDTNGGIDIQGGSSNIQGIIATDKNFRLSSNMRVSGNIYAGNIVVGDNTTLNVNSYTDTEGNKLFGSVYTNNDLEVGNANVSISSGFYGINENNDNTTITGADKPSLSSCILVNSNSCPTINITKQAVLMGVGYIKTSPQYQTGESVAVKGNYEAYTQPLKEDKLNQGKYKEDNAYFEYMSPLTLVKGTITDGDMLLEDKSNYINSYIQEKNEQNGSSDKGSVDSSMVFNSSLSKINLADPNKPDSVLTVGAYVSSGHIYKNTYAETVNSQFIRNKMAKYSKVVYNMKSVYDTDAEDKFSFSSPVDENGKTDYADDFNNYQDNQTTTKSGVKNTTIDDLFDFSKITQTVNDIVDLGSKGKYAVYFNGDSNTDCYIIGDGTASSVASKNTINLSGSQGLKGTLVIAKGNVHIEGIINNANCTIVSDSNVIDEDSVNKTLSKNPCVKELMAESIKRHSFLNELFEGNSATSTYTSTLITDTSVESNVGTDIIRDAKQITMGSWRIVK